MVGPCNIIISATFLVNQIKKYFYPLVRQPSFLSLFISFRLVMGMKNLNNVLFI